MTQPEPIDVEFAIVGGGIAGLYCAWRLTRIGKNVCVFEASKHLGGRILTKRFPDDSKERSAKKDDNSAKGIAEFVAEFGPMRIEPEQQPLLDELLTQIDIKDPHEKQKSPSDTVKPDPVQPGTVMPQATKAPPYLVDFSPYTSPTSDNEPIYPLEGEESSQQSPMDLLKLAFARILGRLVVPQYKPKIEGAGEQGGADTAASKISSPERLHHCLENGRRALTLALASRQPGWQGAFDRWINDLEEEDYQSFREFAEFEYDKRNRVPLWNMGFWNLLTDVLSHNAVIRLRDMGTFYHFISENPNAAEWLVFWLRGFKTSEKLKGIDQGMDSMTEILKKDVLAKCKDGVQCEWELQSLALAGKRIKLSFKNGKEKIAKHIVLALPASALKRVVAASDPVIRTKFEGQLDAVFGLPMVKAFFIVKRRWWEEDYRANVYATRVPTRELHYWKSARPESKKGMVMVYTDRPGSSFWANYVESVGHQTDASWDGVDSSQALEGIVDVKPVNQQKRLILKFLQYAKSAGVESLRASDIEYCGIRDWGREPYVGAAHTWRPERKSWETMSVMSEIKLGEEAFVHVCGEAYSDYQGFIEGALRSTKHTLHRIDQRFGTPTPWLCRNQGCGCAQTGRKKDDITVGPQEKQASPEASSVSSEVPPSGA